MRFAILLLLFVPCVCLSQLISADTNMVCKGQSVRLFVNPKLFLPDDFCLEFAGERNGLNYFSSCNRVSYDDAFAFARIMKGNLATANDASVNNFIASKKSGFIKWLGYYQDPNHIKFNDPPDPSSGFVWMSGAENGYTRWASEEPNNNEDTSPGMNVIIGCSNTSSSEWCDVNKNDGHNYIAIIETKLNEIPQFPDIKILWETGSREREIFVSPSVSKFYKVQISIDGEIYQDSIKISIPEAKAEFGNYGGCGNPFIWNPELITNLPVNDLNITWTLDGAANSLNEFNPTLQTNEDGDVSIGLKVKSLSCGYAVLDSVSSLFLQYPFDTSAVYEKELKLNEIYTLQPVNTKEGFNYKWTPSIGLNNSEISKPEFMASEPITYILTIDDGFGCSIMEEFVFTIDPNIIIYIPEAFTPNNDGYNDILKIITSTGFYGHFRNFDIIDRNAHTIYSTTSIWSWDGKSNGRNAPIGSYNYWLQYDIEKVPYTKAGTILLLR